MRWRINARPLLRPASPAHAVAYFDRVRFGKVDGTSATLPTTEGDGRGTEDIESVALGAWGRADDPGQALREILKRTGPG